MGKQYSARSRVGVRFIHPGTRVHLTQPLCAQSTSAACVYVCFYVCMVFWVFSDIRYVLWVSKEPILFTCVRVGVSPRHAYVSHHPQHENASERDTYLEKGGRNIACRLSARVTRRRKVASTSHRDRRRTAVYLLCVCVFNCV